MNLIADYLELEIPETTNDNVFNAKTIINYSFAKIAVNNYPCPVILISLEDDSQFLSNKNIRLKYLELSYNVECAISEDHKSQVSLFTLIKFRSKDKDLQNYFLKIAETLIKSLSRKPTQNDVLRNLNNFIEIFQSLSLSPRKSLQGLWAELFIISTSKEPETLINYWHTNPEDKFDFNADTERLEVKSSSTMERIHIFSSEQLTPEPDKVIIIASLFTKHHSSGVNLEELISSIQSRLNFSELEEKLFRVVSKILGNSLEQALKIKYDYTLAKNSLKFFNAVDIGKIEKIHIPFNVKEVRYKSDMSKIDSLTVKGLKEFGKFYEAI